MADMDITKVLAHLPQRYPLLMVDRVLECEPGKRILAVKNVSAGTVISRSIRKPGTYTGMFPFDDNASWARNTALVRHLAELAERVGALEKPPRKQRKVRNG